jgi:hypothetical protein
VLVLACALGGQCLVERGFIAVECHLFNAGTGRAVSNLTAQSMPALIA